MRHVAPASTLNGVGAAGPALAASPAIDAAVTVRFVHGPSGPLHTAWPIPDPTLSHQPAP